MSHPELFLKNIISIRESVPGSSPRGFLEIFQNSAIDHPETACPEDLVNHSIKSQREAFIS